MMRRTINRIGLVFLLLVVLACVLAILEIIQKGQRSILLFASLLPALAIGSAAFFLFKKYYSKNNTEVRSSDGVNTSIFQKWADSVGYMVAGIFIFSGVCGLFMRVYPNESGAYNIKIAIISILIGSAVIWKVRRIKS